MALFQAFDISASGMTAERFRMDTIAENIANVNTTRTEDGTPYRRKIVTFAEKEVTPFSRYYQNARSKFVGNGVKVSSVREDTETDFIMEYDPSNPDADENGYVSYPNVNTVTEMTNLIDASRAYEANTTAFEAAKSIAQSGLSMEQYMQFSGMTADGLKEQVRPEALTRIQSSLVLEQIAKEENIEVSDDEINAEVEKMAAQYGMEADKLKEYLGDAEKESIKRDLSVTKAVDLIMENVKERAKAKTKKEKEAEAEEGTEE